MTDPNARDEMAALVRAAAAGDGDAVRGVVDAVQDPVYRLALRMLGHPADAEDAAQEIVVIVVTHLGSFRGESAFMTWVWRIAANHLARVKRGRREVLALDVLDERLRTGLGDEPDPADPEAELLTRELRLRCTEAMILCLDRELRIAYLLGDIFELSGADASAVLDIEPAAYRKRLSRARRLLHGFVRSWCGVYDPANPCRCSRQVACAVERGILDRSELSFSAHPVRPPRAAIERATDEVTEMFRVAQLLRHPDYRAPDAMVARIRSLLDARRLELLLH
ncbi:MAG TPA: sigma-70 family RNA polymerase sigma factor [Kofleriaceae bacterium]|jgi:RNA polymerase sigma factor (sigma-70 family)